MQMKLIFLLPLLFIVGFLAMNYQTFMGLAGARIETGRLRQNAMRAVAVNNPPDAVDFFADHLSSVWTTRVINGAGTVDEGPEFGSGKFEVRDGSLYMYLRTDPEFESKPTSQRYNNVALIGFSGYSPAPGRDIVATTKMQAGPGFFGSAGMVFEPVDTLQQDGSFKMGSPFNMFGVSILGPESELGGQTGAICSLAVNWWPTAANLGDVNIYELHTYEVRLHWLNEQSWLGTISVDGVESCRMELPPFGPVEVQIWSDSYHLSTSPWWQLHRPRISQQNGEKLFRFDAVAVRSEDVP